MYPMLTNEDFISPKDVKGKDVFFRAAPKDLKALPATTVYFLGVLDQQTVDIARERGHTVYRFTKMPAHIFQNLCKEDKYKWKNYT